ncbi:Divalent-cation tolerance protein CutA [Rhodocyclaceae bacterium]|nr:Divalent-cation tolerance protein CutA [Rhodocyclaceae bacterium]
MSDEEVLLVLTNLPDRDSAQRIALVLIEDRAAACVNILAECSSIYRWKGRTETASEVPLLIKTTRAAYPRLEATIRANHPYELPEIIAVSVNAGLPGYLQWVAQETSSAPSGTASQEEALGVKSANHVVNTGKI